MALEFDLFDEPVELDWAAAGRAAQPKEPTPNYTGVGDELAQPDLVCGVAEPAGFGLVVPGGIGPRDQVEP